MKDKKRLRYVTVYINEHLNNFAPGEEKWWLRLGQLAIEAVDSYRPESNVGASDE